ncbi:hypothetical protein B296_00031008 [Ensete ventricosum]|uniref:Uncharacterized protein n=1 Tax=Ensete ventricosum TaxID=4639 RepID=A0A426Y0U3_ENSVE|nr:hypothetical protein B296_00031008 [Ensete ventricosum]
MPRRFRLPRSRSLASTLTIGPPMACRDHMGVGLSSEGCGKPHPPRRQKFGITPSISAVEIREASYPTLGMPQIISRFTMSAIRTIGMYKSGIEVQVLREDLRRGENDKASHGSAQLTKVPSNSAGHENDRRLDTDPAGTVLDLGGTVLTDHCHLLFNRSLNRLCHHRYPLATSIVPSATATQSRRYSLPQPPPSHTLLCTATQPHLCQPPSAVAAALSRAITLCSNRYPCLLSLPFPPLPPRSPSPTSPCYCPLVPPPSLLLPAAQLHQLLPTSSPHLPSLSTVTVTPLATVAAPAVAAHSFLCLLTPRRSLDPYCLCPTASPTSSFPYSLSSHGLRSSAAVHTTTVAAAVAIAFLSTHT